LVAGVGVAPKSDLGASAGFVAVVPKGLFGAWLPDKVGAFWVPKMLLGTEPELAPVGFEPNTLDGAELLEEAVSIVPKMFVDLEEPDAPGVDVEPKVVVCCGPSAPKRLELIGAGFAASAPEAPETAPNTFVVPCEADDEDVCPVTPRLNSGFVG
jgi:hypothetical protein